MALAIVQHQSGIMGGTGPPGSVTLGSTPTAGNLIVMMLHTNTIRSLVTKNTTDWHELEDINNGSSNYGSLIYRYVQGGDTTALPVMWTAGTTYWAYEVYEISGVTGTISVDLPLHNSNFNSSNNTSLASSGTLTTTAANAIALVGAGQYNGNADPTLDVAWTRDEFGHNNSNYGSDVSGKQTGVGSGVGITATVTWTTNSAPSDLIMLVLQPAAGSETGTAIMSFAGISFSAAGTREETSAGAMHFGGIAFSTAGTVTNFGSGAMAFSGIHFAAVGSDRHTGVGLMSFAGITIKALGTDLRRAPSSKLSATLQNSQLQPLTHNIPVVDPNTGFPTPEFQRKWQKQFSILDAQAKVNAAVVPKSYIDAQITGALGAAQTYADVQAAAAQAAAKTYTESLLIPGIQTAATILALTPQVNTRAVVSDANSSTFGDPLASGGANVVPVVYTGTWKIG